MSEFIQFTHLHTHTPEGSLLDGFMRIEKAIEKVKSLGMDALGVSDHGSMAAHFKFYNACKAAGIHPVLGNELYITVDKRFKKADFESVDFTEDEDGNFQFAYFLPEEKPDDYLDIRELKVKSKINKMIAEAKKVFMLEKLAESLLEGEEFPTKKTALNKQIKLLMENYENSGYLLCAKGDFSRRNYFSWFPRIGHLLAIAINNKGYQNLLELNNIGQLEGFYGKPRIDYNDIKRYGAGIAATSACMGSVPNQLILKGYLNEAKEEILRYKDAFELFYLEVQPSRNPEQLAINKQLIEWSKELNIPLICTTDAHMVDRDELELHQTLTNIGQGSSSYSEDSSDISAYDAAYLMTPEEILANGIPREALQNAYDLSHMCQVDFLDHKDTKFPEYQVPPGETFDTHLETLAWQGLFQLFLKKDYIKDYALYQERLKYELDIIKEKGLSAYFIIVQDYIQFAKDKGIYVAPARGSAGGALVAYVLSITELDPIKYNLLFERFLNPERMSLPDIDSDFSHYRRQEVVDYIVDKYGEDQVAKIGTYTKMSTKSILKNVGKVMDIDHNTITEWNKQIPVENGNVMELSEALEVVPVIKKAAKDYPDAFDLALDLENMPKSSSVHACFIPQTPVLTDRGYQNIETLRKGQLVLTHKGHYQPITEVMTRDSYSFVVIHTSSGRILECTPDHPFLVEDRFTQEREWRPAANLTFNDKLFQPIIDEDKVFFDYIYIEDIYSEMRLLTEPVYNISVKEDESYIANGIVVHNCGILINPTSNRAALPLFASKEGDVVTQYEGPILENLGFVKFDVLGIKNLSILEKAINLIKQNHDIEIDLNALEPEDPEVFKLIQSGRTQGIFQISSEGMTEIFTSLNTLDFESLIAGIALYRPGPMEHIPDYIAKANGRRTVTYSTPELKDILEPTYGIAIYQESVE